MNINIPSNKPKRNIATADVKAEDIVAGQGLADEQKECVVVPGGIPGPDIAVPRSELPKEDQFKDPKELDVIRNLLDQAPAGLLGSLVQDIQDLAYAYMDVTFLTEIQQNDQLKKGLAQAAVAHPIGEALRMELAGYHKDKYSTRHSVTPYQSFSWGLTANEFYVATHAECLDGTNARTGSWTAKWKVECDNNPGAVQAEISGSIECRAWCYEDGTAHLLSTQKFGPVTVQADEETPLGKALKNKIVEWEKELMEAITAVYGDQMDGLLKAIRRTLPITKTRLKWELIANRAVKNHVKK